MDTEIKQMNKSRKTNTLKKGFTVQLGFKQTNKQDVSYYHNENIFILHIQFSLLNFRFKILKFG